MEIRIQAGSRSRYWIDVWGFRELLLTLAARDISVRYKQTFFGVAWAVLQPLIAAILMTVTFGSILGLKPTSGTSYVAMVLAGMMSWQLFSSILSTCGQSLVSNANLISKVYFPRIIVPLASFTVALADFFVMAAIFLPILIWKGSGISERWLALPAFLFLTCIAALGPALLICALNVKYRDFRFLLPFIIQMGLYISPVAYSSMQVRDKLGEWAEHAYSLNPIVGAIEGFRWALSGSPFPPPEDFFLSICTATILLVAGVVYFRKVERHLSDVI